MRTGDTQEGINLLQRAEAQQPSAHAEPMIAVAYLKLKQPEKAKQMLDLAKKHSPNNVEIFQAAANFYREEHDYKAAIATLKSAPKMTPSILADLGYTYELDGDKEQAAAGMACRQRKAERNWISAERRAGGIAARRPEKTRTYLNRAAAIDANHYRRRATRRLLAKERSWQKQTQPVRRGADGGNPTGGVPQRGTAFIPFSCD